MSRKISTRFSVGGHSLGGRVATSSVAHMESKVNELRLFDPVGSRKMGDCCFGVEFHRKRRRGIDALRQEIIESKCKKTGLGVFDRVEES